jgi:lipid-A-disaccharide synthase
MKLAVVAGEASGDLHASEVVRELKKLDPSLELFGIGGDLLKRQGMQILQHASEIGIVGLFNVIRHLPMFRRIFRELMERIEAERPDAVLLVDYPDFNLRVARKCKELGLRVVYYISPQLWAWRKGRIKQVIRDVDHMIVLFPFEEEFYRRHNVPVTYVGHPLVEQTIGVKRRKPKEGVLRLALLPGSRRGEVESLLAPMLDAVRILRDRRNIEPFIVKAPTIDLDFLEAIVKEHGVDVPILPHDRGEAVAAADIAICSSGTATLEAAVLGTPAVVVYQLGRLSYALARRLVDLPHFSLVNIVAGKQVLPELIQNQVNGETIAAEVERMAVPETHAEITRELALVRAKLGEPGASVRAAAATYSVMTADEGDLGRS